jgi:hypothetical protein
MKKLNILLLLILTILFFLINHSSAQSIQDVKKNSYQVTYEELFQQLMDLTPDANRVSNVNNFSFKRDVATFELHEGTMYLLSPVRNRTTAAIFVGDGTVTITPPTSIEQKQLYRFYKRKILEKDFKILFLIFADSTLKEFQKHYSFGEANIKSNIKYYIDKCLEYLSDEKDRYFDTSIMKTFLDNQSNGLFYAHFSGKTSDPMFFKIDPYEIEEIRILHRAETSSFYKIPEVVCQYHKKEDYLSNRNLENESKDLIKVFQYRIESTIEDNLYFSANAEIEFTALEPNQNWIYFDLYKEMSVDYVLWDSGEPAIFYKKDDNPVLWIRCDSTLKVHDVKKINLFYRGNLIDRNLEGWIYIKSSHYWYPRYGVRKPAMFDLTFHTPKDFTFISVGDKISSEELDRVITTKWTTQKPIHNASFNLGYYKEYKIEDERIPPITVYMAEGGHQSIAQILSEQGIASGRNMEKQVGADVANSIAFYQHLFGECPVKQFYATETPYMHGLAFPGLIHLSWATFQASDDMGYNEIFRGHEVAHQWWGIGVDFKTYHDQWLSEGFSEYAGLWYMQSVLKNNKKFFNILKEYRKEIFNNRKYLFSSGQEAGPVYLGYRTSSSKTEGDYNLIVYKKGAWILHMLRNMLIDLQTMNEDRFINLLHDFYNTYRGKLASTEDFQKVVEKHIGIDMAWFFRQWVYGTDLPKYKFSYKVNKTKEGKYQVRCRVVQEEVPEDFKMFVNFFIDFGKDMYARIRIMIDKPITEFDLPILPMEPKKIVFNDLESVLCEVKNEKWKD